MQGAEIEIEFAGQHFTLLPQKIAYWQEQDTLLVADVHAGKASHFRKNGIPLTTDLLLNDLNVLLHVTKSLNPRKIVFLGDLYHSNFNLENQLIDSWLSELNPEIELILGNHDKHSYRSSNLTCVEPYEINGIMLCHEPLETEQMHICGHLHPSYTLSGKAKQNIKMPAFYISKTQLILPAFGSVNGGKMYKELVKKSDVVLVTENGLIHI